MKLLFDLQATQTSVIGTGGGVEYARAVFHCLMAHSARASIVGFSRAGCPLDADIAAAVKANGVEVVEIAENSKLQELLSSGRFAGFMSPLPYWYHGLDFSDLAVFFTVHGLRPLEERIPFHARHYAHGPGEWLKWGAKYMLELLRPNWRRGQFQNLLDVPCRQLNIVVPSRHTRYSLIEKLQVPPAAIVHELYSPKTHVVQAAVPDPTIHQRLGVTPGKYLLMVSGGRWIKNSWHGLRAVIDVMDKMPDDRWLPVVITGGAPNGLPRGRRDYVIPTDYLSAEELAAMYEGARAFFYPTINEGFGYPPLEAMARETPVLCSAISSVTEVVGDAGIYFDPHREDEMRVRLRMIVENDDVLTLYTERGSRRLAEVCARQQDDLVTLCNLFFACVENS